MLPFICRALVHFGICSLLNFKYVHLDFFIQNLSIFIIWKFFLMKIFMQKKSENISIYLYLQFFAVWLLLKGLYKILPQVFLDHFFLFLAILAPSFHIRYSYFLQVFCSMLFCFSWSSFNFCDVFVSYAFLCVFLPSYYYVLKPPT